MAGFVLDYFLKDIKTADGLGRWDNLLVFPPRAEVKICLLSDIIKIMTFLGAQNGQMG